MCVMRACGRLPIRISGLVLVAFLWAAGGASAAPAVSVFPVPGSQVAPEGAQITFRGLPVAQLGTIAVTGSRSGAHAGRLAADSDGDGGSFLPSKRFAPGELVTVRTDLDIVGAPGGTFHFRVARPAYALPPFHWPRPGRVANDVWHFHSRPDIRPAAVSIDPRGGGVGGDVFLASQFGPVQDGPEIIDPRGNVVWFKRVYGDDSATDFRVQSYKGQRVLTWWQGYVDAGVGMGSDLILNSSYQEIADVHAGNGLQADLHEFQITPWNTALLTISHPVIWNTSSIRGPKHQVVLDAVVQEIDIPTGLVLFEWDSLDQVPVTASYARLPTGSRDLFDYFHVNSVDVDHNGSLLISGRNTWASYKLDHSSGRVIWTLGGKHSSFRMQGGASFAYQHDVRVRSADDSLVTLFDDSGGPTRVRSQSRGLKLSLDLKHRVAKVAAQVEHVPALASDYEGNYQQLGRGHSFLGWGDQPYFTEFDARGHEVFDGRFIAVTNTYRAYRFQWHATPHTRPAIAASSSGSSTNVYASWNGATDVGSWQVEAGPTAASLRAVRTVKPSGFETAIRIARNRYVCVRALDGKGHVLASSRTIGT